MLWYSHTSELIRVLSFNVGLERIRPWFAVGIALHALDGVNDPTVWDSIVPVRCRATHPQIEDCAISVNLRRLASDRARYDELTDFTDRSRLHLECVPQILEVLTSCALPFLESFSTLEDVRRFAQSERASAFTIREAARTILGTCEPWAGRFRAFNASGDSVMTPSHTPVHCKRCHASFPLPKLADAE